MSGTIRFSVTYPHPPEQVWTALTNREALASWLMPNDFEPVVGHRFTFRTAPAPGFDGIVDCQVLLVDPLCRLAYSWRGGPIDTTVTFLLEEVAEGTRLTLEQRGFAGIPGRTVGWMLGQGWKRMARASLPKALDQIAAGQPVKRAEALAKHRPRPLRMRFSMWLTSRVIQLFDRQRDPQHPTIPKSDR